MGWAQQEFLTADEKASKRGLIIGFVSGISKIIPASFTRYIRATKNHPGGQDARVIMDRYLGIENPEFQEPSLRSRAARYQRR